MLRRYIRFPKVLKKLSCFRNLVELFSVRLKLKPMRVSKNNRYFIQLNGVLRGTCDRKPFIYKAFQPLHTSNANVLTITRERKTTRFCRFFRRESENFYARGFFEKFFKNQV